MVEANIKKMVRIMATDVNGNTSVINAMRKVKGVSFMFSNSICINTKINPRAKIGSLPDSDVKTLEEAINNPSSPAWMLNRRKDPESGTNKHLTGTKIALTRRDDINTMRRIRSYKGVRHQQGQPVRGQRTRSTFRTSKKAVGVIKKNLKQAAKPKPATAKK